MEKVGVVGCGLMGAGIAEVVARAGCDVRVRELNADLVKRGRENLERSLARAQKAGRIEATEASALLGRLSFTTELADLADRELVIEAVSEDEALKCGVFRELDAVLARPDALMASNTSSIPIMRLASMTRRPDRVCGMHFFSPVPVMKLVEVVVALETADDTVERAERFAREQLGKVVIRSRDRAGFIVNALLVPFMMSAMRMYESGFATADDIDAGMVNGCNHPIGPLRLADQVGLDVLLAVAESLHDEFREPQYAPPPLLRRMVEAGHLGRKTGRGFYVYRS
jgi:3-hydroxybutyryl-CoA dehydrogenase